MCVCVWTCWGFLNAFVFNPRRTTFLTLWAFLEVCRRILRHDLWTVELSVSLLQVVKLLVHTAVCDFWCCGVVFFYSGLGWGMCRGGGGGRRVFFFQKKNNNNNKQKKRVSRDATVRGRGVSCCCRVGISGRVTVATAPCPMGSEVLNIFTRL